MFELKILTHFAAAHQLTMVAKQCENLHGHNWKVEVCVIGDKLNDAGVLIDFGVLKTHVAEIIREMTEKIMELGPSPIRIATGTAAKAAGEVAA